MKTSNSDISRNVEDLIKGSEIPGDCGNLPIAPEWLDRNLFTIGRKLYDKYLFSICFAELLGLLEIFSSDFMLYPLIHTGASDTANKAYKRYVSTIKHVLIWAQTDMWDPSSAAHKDIMRIRKLHINLAKKIDGNNADKIRLNTEQKEISCTFLQSLKQDYLENKPNEFLEPNSEIYFSQLNTALTQYGFVGLIVRYPNRMGLGSITEKELEGFIHYWRGIGWLIGLEDKYNLCSGSLEEVKLLCSDIELKIFRNSLPKISVNYEIMTKSITTGLNKIIPLLYYKTMCLYLMYTLNVSSKNVSKVLSIKEQIHYMFVKMVLNLVSVVPVLHKLFNRFCKFALNKSRVEMNYGPTLNEVDNIHS